MADQRLPFTFTTRPCKSGRAGKHIAFILWSDSNGKAGHVGSLTGFLLREELEEAAAICCRALSEKFGPCEPR